MLEVDIRHDFPGFALEVAFSSPRACTTVLFGPSGSGKSTVVGAVAGLFRPRAGRVGIDGRVVFAASQGVWVPPERRACGVVFQQPRLFPHLSVAGNLRYGLRRARRREIAPSQPIAFNEVVALLGLEALLERAPNRLSGGERQRVAIGRALLAQPRLLIMDEPLSSLDGARKAEILPYLARLRVATGLPILYVTHALDEVIRLADRLVLLEGGRLIAAGPLTDILSRGDLALAHRDDAASVQEMTVVGHDAAAGLTRLAGRPDPRGERLMVLVPTLRQAPGARVRIRIPAREVILATSRPEAISVHNVLAGSVRAVARDPADGACVVELDVGGAVLLARVTRDAVSRLRLAPGARAFALIKSVSIDVLIF